MPKLKPAPEPKEVICSVCGLDWDKHEEESVQECIRLLKAEVNLAESRMPPWYKPYWNESWYERPWWHREIVGKYPKVIYNENVEGLGVSAYSELKGPKVVYSTQEKANEISRLGLTTFKG